MRHYPKHILISCGDKCSEVIVHIDEILRIEHKYDNEPGHVNAESKVLLNDGWHECDIKFETLHMMLRGQY